ncbi:hypothetical protein [Chitinophaga sp. sic0106]|uniref:hypothetical protein n=1 Tax=Chitinophaga sp. sic0106 TaxID=2854785 RepID=UPI001C47D98E|nr:hypothetical protein [Chitinophaga sp. sic0106]MBV7529729.1 hypothetical protein [Chitinophaga sp. sic0106]
MKTLLLYAGLTALLLVSGNISAQEPNPAMTVSQNPPEYQHQAPWFVQRFKVTAGLFFVVNNTDVTLENAAGTTGTNINFEDDLGFNKNTATFIGDFQWRISRRSRLDFKFASIRRTSDYTLKKDIQFGDQIYNINSSVHAWFNTDIYRISYGFAFLQSSKYEVGVLVGAHMVGLGIGMELAGNNINSRTERFSITAPLPDVGLWGGYAITDRIAVNGEFSWLKLTIDDIEGRILSGNLMVSYRIIPRLEAAIGYTGFNFNVDATREHLQGKLKWGYNGPSLTVSYAFGKKRWL